MLEWLLPATLFALQSGLAPPSFELALVASTSPRPADCRPVRLASEMGDVWASTAAAEVAEFCRILARGHGTLRERPRQALELAGAARRLEPYRFEPRLLQARARLRLSEYADAAREFEELAAKPGVATFDLYARLDRARAAALSGQLELAKRSYLAWLPESSLLGRSALRQQAHLEVVAVLLEVEGSACFERAKALLLEAGRFAGSAALQHQARLLEALVESWSGAEPRARQLIELTVLPLELRAQSSAERRGAAHSHFPRPMRLAMGALFYELTNEAELAEQLWLELGELGEAGMLGTLARSRLGRQGSAGESAAGRP
jgi:hypothetical protein